MDALKNHILVCLLFMFSVAAARNKSSFLRPRSDRLLSSAISSCNGSICQSVVEKQGYACQEHTVTTEDGFILGLQRIPVGRSGQPANKPPVLLQHGFLMDSGTWIMGSPQESLAFILADSGYDVWLANCRGTASSSRHTRFTPNDPDYWEWSWDELVAYDLPATLQHVKNITGQKMHYIGHSLGTLMALASLSQNGLVSMVRSAVLLGPIAHMHQVPSPVGKTIANFFLSEDLYAMGIRKFPPTGDEMTIKLFLTTNLKDKNCCIDNPTISTFGVYEPQPSSTKNLNHLSQMIRSGNISKYDYGTEADNMNHYNQPTPPMYNMTNIPRDFPLYLGYGGKDVLADPNDVQQLLRALKDHDKDKLVAHYVEEYAHFDLVLASNAPQVLYNTAMAFLSLH